MDGGAAVKKGFIRRCWSLAAVLCLLQLGGAGAETGVVHDEDGGVWDYDMGIYTDAEGNQYEITDDSGAPVSSSSSEAGTRQNADGSITIITGEQDSVVQNADGSITVDSETIQVIPREEESKPLTYEEWQARIDAIADKNGRVTETFYRKSQNEMIPVTVIYVGLARSMVHLNGAEQLVDTCDLIWSTEAPEDKVLAVINAPKNGQAKMRAKTSTKAMVLDTCRTNRVVRVLKVGKSWAFVDHNGLRGYIQTSSLTFFANERKAYETGYISVKGKTPKGETVFIRSAPKNGSRHLEEYPVKTPVTIFSAEGDWLEVDVEGWHCYILAKYVSLNGDPVSRPDSDEDLDH